MSPKKERKEKKFGASCWCPELQKGELRHAIIGIRNIPSSSSSLLIVLFLGNLFALCIFSVAQLQHFISPSSSRVILLTLQSASKADKAAASSPPLLRQSFRHMPPNSPPFVGFSCVHHTPPESVKDRHFHPTFAVFISSSFIMQAVSPDSSLGKAPKACKFCRSRKKKCDKALPRCGFCARLAPYPPPLKLALATVPSRELTIKGETQAKPSMRILECNDNESPHHCFNC